MNLWMLDLDPVKAAGQMCDKHVKSMPYIMAAILASAWHRLESSWSAPLDSAVPETPWVGWLVHPAEKPDGRAPALRKAMFPGESVTVEWSLFKQRIPGPLSGRLPAEEKWVAKSGGNYLWLWQHASEAVAQHLSRFGTRHPVAPAIWTLEAIPWGLQTSLEDWSETPLGIPQHMRVAEDGFYDTVASNRRWYNIMIPPGSWTGPAPEWHTQEHQLSIDS